MAHDVFISHSVKDKATADAVCATLESEGIRCWIAPRDVLPSMEYGEAIIDAIEECRIMVLVFTANANASPQIRREIERAVNHGVAILPLRMEDVLPGKSLEYFIGNVHWLDALTPPFEAHLKNLAGTIKIVLARMEPRDAPPMPHAVADVPRPETSSELPVARRVEPAFTPYAEPVAVPPEEPRPAEVSAAEAAAEDAVIPVPVVIGPATDSDHSDKPSARKLGEWQPISATVAPAPPRKIPVWAWSGGAALAFLLIAVILAVHFTSHPSPVASPEPATPPAQSTSGPAGPSGAEPVTPGPSPQAAPDNAALLRDTMSTTQKELSSIGTVSYTTFIQNKTDGSSYQAVNAYQVSNVVADSSQCRVSFHWKTWQNGTAQLDIDTWIALHEVTSVVDEPISQATNEVTAAAGNPERVVTSTTPPVTVVVVRGPSGLVGMFPFADTALAHRTANTLTEAVKLCGGTLAN